MKKAVVTGSFDDIRSRHMRFLEEASRLEDVHVLLWSDEVIRLHTCPVPFPVYTLRMRGMSTSLTSDAIFPQEGPQ